MWDSPRSSYTKHHHNQYCKHCWIWAKRHIDWTTEEGERFLGDYLAMQCGHCNKLGKILYRWNEELHSKMLESSKKGFYSVHNRGGCPPRSGKSSARELEYANDF